MDRLYNVSSTPHIRSRLSTGNMMLDVIIALFPATIMGMVHFGLDALWVVFTSVSVACLTEFVFNAATKREQTIGDYSAMVTGLLLALTLPSSVPLYIPALGAAFAIFFVKCVFGGLGKNFMNPALAARCFLLISFGNMMTNYTVDAVSQATPLAKAGSGAIDLSMMLDMYIGRGAGVIGNSVGALLIGAAYLWMTGVIRMEIPVSVLASFAVFVGIFGSNGFAPINLLGQICGGGIVLGAFFMATEPVTSPMTTKGRILYGVIIGVIAGLFRVFGTSPDSVSYAIIVANLLVPFIDSLIVSTPFAYRKRYMEKVAKGGVTEKSQGIPKSAVILCVITLIAGLALAGVYQLTKTTIDKQKAEAAAESYREVCPQAASFRQDEELTARVDEIEDVYGTDFGKSYINEVWVAQDEAGNDNGYVICVSSGDAYDGTLAFSVGLDSEGTVTGIAFTELHDSAGMGMLCGEPEFKDQFVNVNTDAFILNKAGGSTAENEIDSVTGASCTSGAVVNAVNAALDFYQTTIKGE